MGENRSKKSDNIKVDNARQKPIIYIISMLAVFFVVLFAVLKIVPLYDSDPHTISIMPTGEQDEDAKGHGILVKFLTVNGEKVSTESIFSDTDWEPQDEGIVWTMSVSEKPTQIDAQLISDGKCSIDLLTNPWCGIAVITIDGKSKTYDTYSEQNGDMVIPINMIMSVGQYCIVIMAIEFVLLCVTFTFCRVFYKKLLIYYCSVWSTLTKVFNRLKDTYYAKSSAICASLFILIIAVLPMLNSVVDNYRYSEDYNNTSGNITRVELTQGTVIKQNLNIDANYESIEIQGDNFGRFNTGQLKVEVQYQNSASSFDIRYTGDKSFISVPKDKYATGPAVLTITAISGKKGSSMGLKLSDQQYYGGLSVDGKANNSQNIAMKVSVTAVTAIANYRLVLWFMLVAMFVLIVWFLLKEKETFGLFFICAAAFALMNCIMAPGFTFMSQPYFEGGSNFLLETYLRPVSASFFLEDFAYWPLFPRIIAYFWVKIIHLKCYAPLAMDLTKVIFIAIAFAMLSLKQFSHIASKELRVCFCFFMYQMFDFSTTQAYHNFSYILVLYIIVCFFIKFRELPKYGYCLLLFSAAIIPISKAHFVVFIPIAIVFAIISLIKNKDKRLLGYSLTVLFSSFTELIYLRFRKFESGTVMTNFLNFQLQELFSILFRSLKLYADSILSILYTGNVAKALSGYALIPLLIIAIIVIVVIALTKLFRRTENEEMMSFEIIGIGLTIILGMGFALLNGLTRADTLLPEEFKLGTIESIYVADRNQVPMYLSILFTLVLVISVLMKITKYNKTPQVLLLCFALIIPNGLMTKSVIMADQTWKYEYQNIDNPNFVINTGNRFSGRNFMVYYIGSKSEDELDKSVWNYTWGSEFAENTDVGSSISLQSLDDKTLLSIFARKSYKSTDNDITAVYYDSNNNVVRKIKAGSDDDQFYMVFTDGTEISGVSRIEFFGADDAPISLQPDFYIGVVGENAR